jgi:hypothetical protein
MPIFALLLNRYYLEKVIYIFIFLRYYIVMSKRTKNYRKIWEKYHKASLLSGIHIHHIDGKHNNHNPENLLACTPEEHWQIHYNQGDVVALCGKFIQKAGGNGKPHTKESKRKISKSRKGIVPVNKGKKCPNQGLSGKENPMYRKSSRNGKSKEENQIINKKLAISNGSKPFLVFKNNIFIKEYVSKSQCERDINVKRQTIKRILNGEPIKNRKGYTFRYK